MTDGKLAAACEMQPTYVRDVEGGARDPGWKAGVRLAGELDVSVRTIAAAFDGSSGAGGHGTWLDHSRRPAKSEVVRLAIALMRRGATGPVGGSNAFVQSRSRWPRTQPEPGRRGLPS